MKYPAASSLPGPDNIRRSVFPNGFTVLVRENPYSATVSIKGALPCGAHLESNEKLGLTEFIAGCLTAGTALRNFGEIHTQLEESGASLGFNVGTRSIGFDGSCLAEDLPMLLSLLKEILDVPSFPEEHIEIYRRRALSAYELHLHDPESMTNERFDSLLFGDHPYGRPEFGPVNVINGITRSDLLSFQQAYFGPQEMILTIAGGIRADEVLDECEKVFGNWTKPQKIMDTASYFPQVPGPDRMIREHIEIPDKSELSLVMGTLGPSRTDPNYHAAVLGNSILGEFGMMGRLGRSVREDNGLAYSVTSSVDALHYGGCWSVEAGVNPANVEKAEALILDEIRRFVTEKVSDDELNDVKSAYVGGLPLSLESNAGTAGLLLNIETYHFGLDYLLRLPDWINAVTPDLILETARQWLDPDRLIIVTAGTSTR